jgi:hypothetical protein
MVLTPRGFALPQFYGNGYPRRVSLRVVSRARSDHPTRIYVGVDTLRTQRFTILGTANMRLQIPPRGQSIFHTKLLEYGHLAALARAAAATASVV